MKRKEIKQGQLVRLANNSQRWSGFVALDRVGIVVDLHKSRIKVLFTDGELEEHWYFSLEGVSEKSRT